MVNDGVMASDSVSSGHKRPLDEPNNDKLNRVRSFILEVKVFGIIMSRALFKDIDVSSTSTRQQACSSQSRGSGVGILKMNPVLAKQVKVESSDEIGVILARTISIHKVLLA